MYWFINHAYLREVEAWRRNIALSHSVLQETAAKLASDGEEGTLPRLLRVVGSEGIITISGALSARPSPYLYLFDGGRTTYSEIQAALAACETHTSVKRVSLMINSPGGTVDGFFELLAYMQAFAEKAGKPMTARVTQAESAGYGIASKCVSIEAQSPASLIGSLGVATSYVFWGDMEEVRITNTESPDKRPDVRTEEGRAVVARFLDEYADLFAEAVSKGRKLAGKKLAAKDVYEAYGRGATFLTASALERGMIDAVAKPQFRIVRSSSDAEPGQQPEQNDDASAQGGADNREPPAQPPSVPQAAPRGTETVKMDPKKLKADHPEVYEAVFNAGVKEGQAAGVKSGADAERERVLAHLTMGEASGDMKTALDAIAKGDAMTQSLQAKYMAAGMNRASTAARQGESAKTAEQTTGTATPGSAGQGPDLGDQVVAKLQAGAGAIG